VTTESGGSGTPGTPSHGSGPPPPAALGASERSYTASGTAAAAGLPGSDSLELRLRRLNLSVNQVASAGNLIFPNLIPSSSSESS
jgi:hypothetical protein